MSFYSLKNLSFGTKFSIVAGVLLVFGLFGGVLVSQQRQETRSNAAGNCSANTNGDLIADNCTAVNVSGYLIGNNNNITNNVGNVFGNGNRIGNNVAGCVTGDNNHVGNNVLGSMRGSGNTARQVANIGGCSPNPYITPTSSPTPPPTTCADGIDNNQNELIDRGDPACHTDGNQDNPNSYDSHRSEVNLPTPTPSRVPTPTPTRIPTSTPTPTLRPTITPTPTPVSRCSDNIDNDNNGFKDSFDSTCHTDNNPNNPNSYDPTRPGEQGGGNTCADSRDNNNNGVIDGGDPICHTDGNPNNPNSYDPSRNETSPTTPPTLTPTPTRTPTSTPVPGNTSLVFNLLLHGIGSAGDSANPGSGGNQHPLHPQRNVRVEVLNAQNQLILTKDGVVNFSTTGGNFTGTVDAGTTLVSGVYTIKVKTNQFLKALTPGIQNIIAGGVNQMPQTTLINGEINGDNTINILDYNILIGCYSDLTPAVSCTAANNLLADLDDDGHVNQFDYNLFLRELTNRQGV